MPVCVIDTVFAFYGINVNVFQIDKNVPNIIIKKQKKDRRAVITFLKLKETNRHHRLTFLFFIRLGSQAGHSVPRTLHSPHFHSKCRPLHHHPAAVSEFVHPCYLYNAPSESTILSCRKLQVVHISKAGR